MHKNLLNLNCVHYIFTVIFTCSYFVIVLYTISDQVHGSELIKCIAWMQCKSLWIKEFVKCINVNRIANFSMSTCMSWSFISHRWHLKWMKNTITIKPDLLSQQRFLVCQSLRGTEKKGRPHPREVLIRSSCVSSPVIHTHN